MSISSRALCLIAPAALRWWLSLLSALVVLVGTQPEASGQGQEVVEAGVAVALAGTPHVWVADGDGVLHWVGDARVLFERGVGGEARHEIGVEQLRAQRRGEPWLSAGLLKDGEMIYLPKWEGVAGHWALALHHIQSLADVELFGIDEGNYDRLVLDRADWEQRYGFALERLEDGERWPTAGTAVLESPTAPPIAGLYAAEQVDAFVQTALTPEAPRDEESRLSRWATAIRLQGRGALTPGDDAALDRLVAALRRVVPVEVLRAPSDGNLMVHYVPRTQFGALSATAAAAASDPTKLGHAEARTLTLGGLWVSRNGGPYVQVSPAYRWVDRCTAAVDSGQAQVWRDRILFHEVGHCLGLAYHNNRNDSFMRSSAPLLPTADYPPIDQAMLRLLYDPRLKPGTTATEARQILTP